MAPGELDVTIRLVPLVTRKISGVVVGVADEPVEGAIVMVCRWADRVEDPLLEGTSILALAHTDDEGRFELTVECAGDLALFTQKDGVPGRPPGAKQPGPVRVGSEASGLKLVIRW